MNVESELNGAWEERGVIGIRIEIEEPNITVLWRNAPVLKTTFQRIANGDEIELKLKKNGMRYAGTNSDYASLEKLCYKEDKIEMIEHFPITGDSSMILTKTENSRYGNYTIVDEKLEELQGTWIDENDFYELQFSKDELSLGDKKIKIHVLHSNSETETSENYKIVNQDPSVYEVLYFFHLEYRNGELFGQEMILDAQPKNIVFKKIK